MRTVLERSGINPADIDYIEAHGTGTAVGDPVETSAIGAVYGQERDNSSWMGSVKRVRCQGVCLLHHGQRHAGLAAVMKWP